MPTSLTTVTTGTPISAADLTAFAADIEYFINENITSEMQTAPAWVTSTHIYRPEFRTLFCPRTRLVSGEIHWRYRDHTENARVVRHSAINTITGAGTANRPGPWVNIDGMETTWSVPEPISSGVGEPKHRALVLCHWHTHEIGGMGDTDEGATTGNHCSDFAIHVDGDVKDGTVRPLYSASVGDGTIRPLAIHQYSAMYPAPVAGAGKHDIGLQMRMYSDGGNNNWRHVFVWGRSTVVGWFRL